jgi:hypothetical protein
MHTTEIDLTPVWQSIITLCGMLLTAFGTVALQRLQTRFHLQNNAALTDAWNAALQNSVVYGSQMSTNLINEHGWEHPTVHNQIVAYGATYLVAHWPDLIKAVGLKPNLDDPNNEKLIVQALQRALPAGTAIASKAPSTPDPPHPHVANVPSITINNPTGIHTP